MHEAETSWLGDALHDLCQPLTALQCRLFLASLAEEDCAEMVAAVRESLRQCERAIVLVRGMQARCEG